MSDFLTSNLWAVWTILSVACLIAELCTGGFFIICFAAGAVAAAVVSLLFGFVAQLVTFIVVSGLSIFLVRPFVLKYLHPEEHTVVSNADAILGRVGCVSETIKAGGFGRVALDGDDWKAQSSALDADIKAGTKVRIVGRESLIIDVVPVSDSK